MLCHIQIFSSLCSLARNNFIAVFQIFLNRKHGVKKKYGYSGKISGEKERCPSRAETKVFVFVFLRKLSLFVTNYDKNSGKFILKLQKKLATCFNRFSFATLS
jgi:hypothetical protein